jgi:hypothetical protein
MIISELKHSSTLYVAASSLMQTLSTDHVAGQAPGALFIQKVHDTVMSVLCHHDGVPLKPFLHLVIDEAGLSEVRCCGCS